MLIFRQIIFSLVLAASAAPRGAWAEERLAMPQFPTGWVEAFSRGGIQEMIEYVPPGQTASTWQRKIILEIYHDFENLPLDTLQRRAASQNRDACKGVVEGKFQSGVNNGYPSAFWTLGCKREKTSGLGETRYTKVIQGRSGLYMLTQVWRTPAYETVPNISTQEIEGVMAFLTSSVLCDPDVRTSACPDEAPAPRK
ncbi:MAG: hypothetical protein K2P94_16210 [Rhodospirillaceae bacterium]|nr:hypothetical protein [Rhodospirillaceae bacterium]